MSYEQKNELINSTAETLLLAGHKWIGEVSTEYNFASLGYVFMNHECGKRNERIIN